MLKLSKLICLLIATLISFNSLALNNHVNYGVSTRGNKSLITLKSNTYLIQNMPFIFNSKLDEVNMNDPRIKSIMQYSDYNHSKIVVIVFNPNNLEFTQSLITLLTELNLKVIGPLLATANNVTQTNQVNVYLTIGDNNVNK